MLSRVSQFSSKTLAEMLLPLLLFSSVIEASVISESNRRVLGGLGVFDEGSYMVAFLNPTLFCGGAVITNYYVTHPHFISSETLNFSFSQILTAAECIATSKRRLMHFKMGVASLRQKGVIAFPFRFYQHDSYVVDSGFHLNAIGMVRTKDAIQFDEPCFSAIPLPTKVKYRLSDVYCFNF